MAICKNCGKPLILSGGKCLYCGKSLDERLTVREDRTLDTGISRQSPHFNVIKRKKYLSFDEARSFSEGLAMVTVDRYSVGYIGKNGQWVIEPKFYGDWPRYDHREMFVDERSFTHHSHTSTYDIGDFSQGMAVVRLLDGGRIKGAYINRIGNIVIKDVYGGSFHDGLAWYYNQEIQKYGYIDIQGRMVIPPRFTCANHFSKGIADGSKFCNECGTPLNGGSIGSSQSDSSTGSPIIDNLISNMVYVEGGTFMMGATSEQVDDAFNAEKPAHRVTLSSFSIGCYEVTQEEWEVVMGNNPSNFKGAKRPVENVCWYDCQDFIRKLNAMTGMSFRLPTEAEWEFAARGGNKSKGFKYSGSNSIDEVAWYDDNSDGETHPVGSKDANELGLYDMSGNVYEWCEDRFGDYSSSPQTNPKGPNDGSRRVDRGGSWRSDAGYCRVSYRLDDTPVARCYYLGFRLAL